MIRELIAKATLVLVAVAPAGATALPVGIPAQVSEAAPTPQAREAEREALEAEREAEREAVQEERERQRVERAVVVHSVSTGKSFLGVEVNDVDKERVAALKLSEERGVEITMVDRDAPAGKAGLREKDVILEFNGERVEGKEQLRRMIQEIPPGRTVTLGIIRDGQPTNVEVKLGERKQKHVAIAPRAPMPPRVPRMPIMPEGLVMLNAQPMLGVQVESLTPQLAEYFGVKSGDGLLVRTVERGSPAEASGMKAGDIIVRVQDQPVTDRADLRRALRQRSGPTPMTVIRDKREVTLTVNLPERQRGQLELDVDPAFAYDFDFDFDFDIPDFELEIPAVEHRKMIERMRETQPRIQRAMAQIEPKMKLLQKTMEESMLEMHKRMLEVERRLLMM